MAANLEIVIKGIDHASGVFKNVDDHATKAGSAMGTILKAGALAAGAGLVGAGFAAVKFIGAASDLNESINKSTVVFGAANKIVEDFAATSAKSFGIAKGEAFAYAGTLGTILKGSGLSQEASAGMSTELVKLAADMASFNNIPIDQALEKIRAGLVGESEPLRTVGVLLSEAAVAEEAYATGIAAAGSKLTDQQKVQARYSLILKQTSDTQGDFARTSDGMANQQRILAAQWKDLQGIIGNALLPVAVKLGAVFVHLATAAVPKVQEAIKLVTMLARAFIAAASGEGITSTGIFGFFEELGVIVHDRIIPAVQGFAKFFKGTILPAVKEFVGNKNNLVALGGAIVALFTAWAISAGIAAVATIAATAPFLIMAVAIAGLGAAFVLLEQKTGFFSAALPVVTGLLQDLHEIIGPVLFDALVTLRQGWEDLQPAIDSVAAFLNSTLVPAFEAVGKFLLDHPVLLIALAAAIALLVAPWLLVIGTIILVLAKWDEIKAMFTQTIPQAVDSVIKKIQELPIIGAIFTDAWNTVRAVVELYVGLVLVQVNFLFDTISNTFAFWKAIFTGDWNGAWNALKDQAAAIWNALSGAFGLALDAFSTVLSSKLQMLRDLGATMAGAITDGFKAAWNAAAGAINSAIPNSVGFDVPKVSVAGVTVPGTGGSIGIDLPNDPIPQLAQGGLVTRTGIAEVHRGEVFSGVGGSFGGTVNVNIYSTFGPDPQQMEQLRQLLGKVMRQEYRFA